VKRPGYQTTKSKKGSTIVSELYLAESGDVEGCQATQSQEHDVWLVITSILGLTMGMLATILLVTLLSTTVSGIGSFSAMSLIVSALAVLLMLVAVFNDPLVTPQGQTVIESVALITSIICPLTLLGEVPSMFTLIITPLLFTSFILIWGAFLSSLNHQVLQSVTVVSFIITGIVLLLVFQFQFTLQMVFISLAVLLSWGFLYIAKHMTEFRLNAVNKALSKERVYDARGRRTGLPTVGFLLGSSMTIAYGMGGDYRLFLMLVGISILIAGLLVFWFRKADQIAFEAFAHRSLAALMALGLLPLPFVPMPWVLVLGSYLMVVAFMNTIITVNVMAELTRFNQSSPVWTYGSEMFVFLVGAIIGQVVFDWGLNSITTAVPAFTVVCLATVAFANILQIVTDNHAFKFLTYYVEEVDSTSDENLRPNNLLMLRGGMIWKGKLNTIASTNHLSPRQREVMELLAKGRNIDYIMKHFSISRSTAKTHIYTMYHKLQIRSRQELLSLIENVQIDVENN